MRNRTALLRVLATCASFGVLCACESPTVQRYAASADNANVLRQSGLADVTLGSFVQVRFDAGCRGFGSIEFADGLSPAEYVRRAFEDEIKAAGAHAAGRAPKLEISGALERVEFSTTNGLTGGEWALELSLRGSNGITQRVAETYTFRSGFAADAACQNAAAAFPRAVQNLVAKAVRGPVFAAAR
jgi:hypothetical protein